MNEMIWIWCGFGFSAWVLLFMMSCNKTTKEFVQAILCFPLFGLFGGLSLIMVMRFIMKRYSTDGNEHLCPDGKWCKFTDVEKLEQKLAKAVEALEDAEVAYNAIISLTPTSRQREKLTEMNILRLAALKEIEK